jgi:hypothetical protein
MPERFPALVAAAAFLFTLGLALSFTLPLAVEAGQVAHVKELTADE